MKIAPYYQKLLQKCVTAATSFEPITFIGMFDSGIDYLFTMLRPLLASELSEKVRVAFVDLSGLVEKGLIVSELWFGLFGQEADEKNQSYASLTKEIMTITQKEKVLLVIYLGQEGQTDQGFFLLLNRLRNLLGWNFSYCIFATTRILSDQKLSQPLVHKVLKRNLVPVLPLVKEDALLVLVNYEERYKQSLPDALRIKIVALSGGNPGLVKALYLQAISTPDWQEPDYLEEQLYFRLSGIAADISSEMQKYLFTKSKQENDVPVERILFDYGYARRVDGKITPCTPMIAEFMKQYAQKTPHEGKMATTPADPFVLNFTRSQRKVLQYLTEHRGELVSKDTIAKILWGEAWADKYSDWAIDQLLSTLREKLASLKFKEKIVTKKGEGIIYLSKK